MDLYKKKIDAFINYDIYNNLNEDDSSEKSPNNSISKVAFNSLFDKYNRLTENLLSQIKISENDILKNNSGDLNISYEIYANPEMQLETLNSRLNELEDMVNSLERSIGSWGSVNNIINF